MYIKKVPVNKEEMNFLRRRQRDKTKQTGCGHEQALQRRGIHEVEKELDMTWLLTKTTTISLGQLAM